jgi:hypothetical protein
VLAATYHQVWWPPATEVKYHDGELPVWHETSGNYLDPATGEVLPTWDQALDALGDDSEPFHVARFGERFDAQGLLAGSRDANKCIGYLTKYLTKHLGDCHQAASGAQAAHADRLVQALRYEPCSPRCANWLRYGIQPKTPRPGLRPGYCRGQGPPSRTPRLRRAPRPGLPQMVRQNAGRPPRRPQGVAAGHARIPDADPGRYTWEPVTPGDPDHMPPAQRMLHVVADRQRWHAALAEARRRANSPPDLSATGEAA